MEQLEIKLLQSRRAPHPNKLGIYPPIQKTMRKLTLALTLGIYPSAEVKEEAVYLKGQLEILRQEKRTLTATATLTLTITLTVTVTVTVTLTLTLTLTLNQEKRGLVAQADAARTITRMICQDQDQAAIHAAEGTGKLASQVTELTLEVYGLLTLILSLILTLTLTLTLFGGTRA